MGKLGGKRESKSLKYSSIIPGLGIPGGCRGKGKVGFNK